MTTQYASQTLITALTQSPEILRKVRTEFNNVVAKDFEIKNKSTAEILQEAVNLESICKLDYLSYISSETLRMQSPTQLSSFFYFMKDMKVGNLNVRKGDEFSIYLQGLHLNTNEWQKPHEFIPERFDSSNPINLTPSG